ncbi:MAG: phytoene desaturase family protein [Halodesulfurarchaeum sp.]
MQGLDDRSVIVIGAGFGGLSTAVYLADAGARVTVVEKNEQLGGRATVLEADGFRFDVGPSWYLMPDVFERFFDHFDRSPSAFYDLEHLDPHYRIFFKENVGPRPDGDPPGLRTATDGDRVDITADLSKTIELFDAFEDGAGEALESYLERSRTNYEIGMKHFVYDDRSRLRDFLDPSLVRHARGLTLLGTMQDHVESYFDHSKLQQILQYTLVFLGGSPHNTPALYNLMSHVDFNLGVFYPEGGMGGVVDAFVELGRDLGVEFVTDDIVREIRGGRGAFTVEADSGYYHADLIVSDADYAHTEQELLAPSDRQYGTNYWESRTYAPSAFMLYLGVEGAVPELAHHTLVLPESWDEHFAQIFDDPRWPTDPAYYVSVPSETDETVAPDGHSTVVILVPIAPGLDDGHEQRAAYRDTILADLASETETDLRDRIVFEESIAVSEYRDWYNSWQGTALGLAHTLKQTALFRPPHRSSALDGLYYTGSYTTPGIGVPMTIVSGEHTAKYLLEDETG